MLISDCKSIETYFYLALRKAVFVDGPTRRLLVIVGAFWQVFQHRQHPLGCILGSDHLASQIRAQSRSAVFGVKIHGPVRPVNDQSGRVLLRVSLTKI